MKHWHLITGKKTLAQIYLHAPIGSYRKEKSLKDFSRLRVDPHFSSGIVERAKRDSAWKSPHARKGLSPRRVSPFLAWGDFHARSRFTRSTLREEKWGTTRSLKIFLLEPKFLHFNNNIKGVIYG